MYYSMLFNRRARTRWRCDGRLRCTVYTVSGVVRKRFADRAVSMPRWSMNSATVELRPVDVAHDTRNIVGRGGSGIVHRGTLTRGADTEPVAIKRLSATATSAEERRFRRELAVSLRASQRCSRACRLYGYVSHEGALCLVMRLYQNSLHAFLDARRSSDGTACVRPLTNKQVEAFAAQILEGLVQLHAEGIVAQDLKPSNLLMDENEQLFIADFGLAAILNATVTTQSMTDTGGGTPAYKAPEQYSSDDFGRVSSKTDIWAFGCVVVEMLTGFAPWRGKQPMEIMMSVAGKRQAPAVPVEVRGALGEILQRCLSIDQDARPTAVQALATLRPDHAAPSNHEEVEGLMGSPRTLGLPSLPEGDPISHKSSSSDKLQCKAWCQGTGKVLMGILLALVVGCVWLALIWSNGGLLNFLLWMAMVVVVGGCCSVAAAKTEHSSLSIGSMLCTGAAVISLSIVYATTCFWADTSEYPDAVILSGCVNDDLCGTFLKTEYTCDDWICTDYTGCVPTYQKGGRSEAIGLYNERGKKDYDYGGCGRNYEAGGTRSRWIVRDAEAPLEVCVASGWSEDTADPLAMEYNLAGGWREEVYNSDELVYGRISVNASDTARAETCELRHGTWASDDETCACSGDYIGELCDLECACSGHGTQLALEAAREADSCDAGACHCDEAYFGERCQQSSASQLLARRQSGRAKLPRTEAATANDLRNFLLWMAMVVVVGGCSVAAAKDGHKRLTIGSMFCTGAVVITLSVIYAITCFFAATSDYPDAIILSGCDNDDHCGTFLKTNYTCDCAPTYQKGNRSGPVLYRAEETTYTAVSYRWYVGSVGRLTKCGYISEDRKYDDDYENSAGTYLASGRSEDKADPLAMEYNLAGGWREWTGYDSRRSSPYNWADRTDDDDVIVYGRISVNASDTARAETCELRHGTWASDDETCACSGDYIGELCDLECACSGHGTQLALEAAREADSCDAGACRCVMGYYGAMCEQGGR
eukprot:COSAG02_NODE_1162_length_14168_cov_10.478570_10_plen_990_part_00